MIAAIASAAPSTANPRAESLRDQEDMKGGNASMAMEDFLQLLTTQIANQDPLEPMKDTEFISQMANVASLEQMQQFTQGFDNFAESQRDVAAQAYLGRRVTLQNETGEKLTGIAEAVERSESGELSVTVDGKPRPLSEIIRVELADEMGSK